MKRDIKVGDKVRWDNLEDTRYQDMIVLEIGVYYVKCRRNEVKDTLHYSFNMHNLSLRVESMTDEELGAHFRVCESKYNAAAEELHKRGFKLVFANTDIFFVTDKVSKIVKHVTTEVLI